MEAPTDQVQFFGGPSFLLGVGGWVGLGWVGLDGMGWDGMGWDGILMTCHVMSCHVYAWFSFSSFSVPVMVEKFSTDLVKI